MKKLILTLIFLFIVGLAHAGPECRTYGLTTDDGDRYQIEFGCQLADGFLGVLKLINNGEVMLDRVYLFVVDPETGEPTVFIPRVCKLVYNDDELIYQDMVFREEE